MNKILFYLLYLLISFSCQYNQKNNDSPNKIIKGKVIKIADGDSFTLLTENKKQIKIRMYGIDAPERKQAFYQKAKNNLARYIFKKKVTIQIKSTDQYQRIVGVVFLNDTLNINLQMIKDGYAWHYKKYSTDQVMAKAEKEAKQNKLGLWKENHPLPPWEWRRMKRKLETFN